MAAGDKYISCDAGFLTELQLFRLLILKDESGKPYLNTSEMSTGDLFINCDNGIISNDMLFKSLIVKDEDGSPMLRTDDGEYESYFDCTNTHINVQQVFRQLIYEGEDGKPYLKTSGGGSVRPRITLSLNTLSFADTEIGQISDSQSFTVSGVNLTANIVITAPAGFIINQDNSTDNESPITLVPVSGVVSATTIYCSFDPSLEQEYSANISATSTGATTKNISVNGLGLPSSVEKYYDFKIVSTDLTPMPPMDGLGAVSYDYLNTGTAGILTVCGWTGVSIDSIFYSEDNGLTMTQMADFPGAIRHVFSLSIRSDGKLLMLGGDKNELPYGSNEAWIYEKNSTPGLEGTWTQLTSNMNAIYNNRIMGNFWSHGGYRYCMGGQDDNAGGTMYLNVIRIPELTTTGEDWELVYDLTAFCSANSIVGLSNCSVSFDGTNAIFTGGLKYTGSFATNVYNDKVLRATNGGTTWTVVGTLNSGSYPNGIYAYGKHWVQFGALTTNLKGLYSLSSDFTTWTENYDGPSSRHAGQLIFHDGKIGSIGGNLWNDYMTIEEKDYPYEVNNLIKNWWLFLPDKPSETTATAYGALAETLDNVSLWDKIKYFYSVPGLTTANNRKIALKRNKNLVNIDSYQYKTPYPASDTGVQVITDGGNPDHITIKSVGGYNSGTYISTNFRFDRDNDGLTVDNNSLFVFTFSQGDEGVDGGIFSGPAGQLIVANDINFGAGGFVGGLFTNYAIGTAPANSIGLRGVMKFDSSNNIKMVANSSVQTVLTTGVDSGLIDSIERLCAVNQRSNREQTMYIRAEALSNTEVSDLYNAIVQFFADMNMAIPT